MFELKYHTRCVLCRAGFLACCVLPTCAVLAWAGWLSLPTHLDACRRELERELRLPVKLRAVAHPRPGVVVYQGLQLIDPESGATLLSAAQVEVGQNESSRVLIAGELKIEPAAFEHCRRLLDQRLRENGSAITLLASRLVIAPSAADEPPQTLEQICGKLETLAEGPQFSVQFRLPEAESPRPVSFKLARVRHDGAIRTGIELDTGGAALPCSLAQPLLAWLLHLGPRATFAGRLLTFSGDDGWRGELQGRLAGVELARLVGDNFAHEISGLAEVRIDQARFAGSRLTDLRGRLIAGPGAVGQSLRLAAMRALEMNHRPPAEQTQGPVLYEQLAFDFRLDGQGLMLGGCCDRAPPGAVLTDDAGWLLGEPRVQPQPAARLIQALAPHDAQSVPANRHSGWLLDVLPLP